MKKNIFIFLIIITLITLSVKHSMAEFDWGNGNGNCSGSGSFKQEISYYDTVNVGEIPAGKEGVYIRLTSSRDVDIQLFDVYSGERIVHWPYGILNGHNKQTTNYRGVNIEWSGYNGDGTGLGNEYIKISGMTNRPFMMKAFGYQAGYANVNYSWTGTQGCTSNKPSESGSGTFNQQIPYYNTVEVGTLVKGLNNVYIELICDNDVDIQLHDLSSGKKIVHWPDGILNGSSKQSTNYYGVNIEWSGYNGDGSGLGHEYIKITGETNRSFIMKAFGYRSGYATINYSWGGNSYSTYQKVLDSKYIVDNNNYLSFNAPSSDYGRHKGIDYMTSNANPSVYAVCDGKVKLVNTDNPKYSTKFAQYWSAFIIVEHKCNNKTFYAYYGHLENSKNLQKDDTVKKGDVIGKIRDAYNDNDTLYRSNNHLHFGINDNYLTSGWGRGNLTQQQVLNEGWHNPTTFFGW